MKITTQLVDKRIRFGGESAKMKIAIHHFGFTVLVTLVYAAAQSAAWAQTQSCAPLVSAANANFPGLDQRLKENAQQFDVDFLRDRIAKAKLTAKDEPAKALTVCIFEQELVTRSRGSAGTTTSTSAGRDDPKVFGRTMRGG
jgi:hypothetical protein